MLFHFKSKDQTSSLFEHFSGINKRNQQTKIKQSKVHRQIKRTLMDQCFMRGYRLKTANYCKQTGWPINYLISRQNAGKDEKDIAVNFLQRQELTHNI